MTAVEGFRLSPQQRRIWHLRSRSAGPGVAWCSVRLRGSVDAGLLRDGLARSVARHEILRTTFQVPPGLDVPLQVVHNSVDTVALDVYDLRAASQAERTSRYADLCAADRRRPMDPARVPSLSATLVRLAAEPADERLLLRLPVLCADRATLVALVRELIGTLASGPADEPLQYADFAQWQDDLLTDAEFQLERDYWLERDRTGRAPGLPFVWSREPSPGRSLASVPIGLPPEVLDDLRALGGRLDVETSTIALACWHLHLRALAGSAELAVGVHHPNRRAAATRDALGNYEKYLPSVGPMGEDVTAFSTFVRRLHAELGAMTEVQEHFGWDLWAGRTNEPRTLDAGFDWWEPERADAAFAIEEIEAETDRFPVRLSGRVPAGSVHLNLRYDTGSVAAADATVLAGQYAALLRVAVAYPDSRTSDLALDDRPPRRTPLPRPSDLAVHRRFEDHARSHPDRVAARSADEALTYSGLDERANQVAHHLRALGAGIDEVVGLCLDRSVDLLASLLGIHKAGAAYLAIDPALPSARRRAMLDAAGVRLLVTTSGHAVETAARRTTVCLDTDAAVLARRRRDNPAGPPAGGQLAYVVFTSGSSGAPKGVGVTHANLAGYVEGVTARLGLPDGAGYAILSTLAADLGNTTLFAALTTGGTLHLLSDGLVTDPASLGDHLRREPIDCLKVTPSHLRALLDGPRPETVLPARCLVLGGEEPGWDLVRTVQSLAPGCRVLNHYGPTETTVGVLTHELEPGSRRADTVPLGRPLSHAHVHVLDGQLRPTSTWVAGDIHVGGNTVARGYVGLPALTADRFVPDPFSATPGARLYRTGDRARRLADDTLVFLGRLDHQVKVRGFRVELGEIEKVLRDHVAVHEAVVVLDDGAGRPSRLLAYVVATPGTTTTELADRCARNLPDHMVPAVISLLDAMPLTPNGKVDREGLPAPATGVAEQYAAYAPPSSPAEEALAAIWCDVLGVARVGRHDNFFALGGDSILSIQVVARAARADLVLTPKVLFRHPTVAELADVATRTRSTRVPAEQGVVTGPVPPTPIQRWFLDQDLPAPHHYNQEILLRVRDPLECRALRAALTAVVSHHDALRLRLRRDGEVWALDSAGLPGPDHRVLVVADLTHLPAGHRAAEFERLAAATQAGIDLGAGQLLHALYVMLGDAGDRLLLVVHHLGVDGVSWRILLEDLTSAYTQATLGRPVTLPAKTTAFRDWARRLADQVTDLAAEVPRWTDILSGGGLTVPYRGDPAANTRGTARTITICLTPECTRAALRPAGGASTQEMLLTALGHALADWTGNRRVVVDIEGHGRDVGRDDIDLSRTVGWFTTIHPAVLDATGDHHTTLRRVREHLATVPGGGLGYSVLRCVEAGTATERLRTLPAPAVRFNYHGQVVGGSESTLFGSAEENVGPSADPHGRRPYLIDVTAVVADGVFQVAWIFCPELHERTTVEALAVSFVDHLDAAVDTTAYTPADFPLAGLDQVQLDAISGMLQEIDGR
jgi:amino acid adenylation domain-containing protein/non-ribosomal peptide synthase protein (TIGR01720 family)